MTLDALKETYLRINNINLVNLINEIIAISSKTDISINKIITYKQSNCTSKIDKKNLNILEQHYPYEGELSIDEVMSINRKNEGGHSDSMFDELERQNSTPIEIKIEKFKNVNLNKKTTRKKKTPLDE